MMDGTDSSSIVVVAAVREITNCNGAHVIFECVGKRETMDACVGWAGALGRRGRLILIGYHACRDGARLSVPSNALDCLRTANYGECRSHARGLERSGRPRVEWKSQDSCSFNSTGRWLSGGLGQDQVLQLHWKSCVLALKERATTGFALARTVC